MSANNKWRQQTYIRGWFWPLTAFSEVQLWVETCLSPPAAMRSSLIMNTKQAGQL
jgi:hypothetical protein